jgi:hypothetical protein
MSEREIDEPEMNKGSGLDEIIQVKEEEDESENLPNFFAHSSDDLTRDIIRCQFHQRSTHSFCANSLAPVNYKT